MLARMHLRHRLRVICGGEVILTRLSLSITMMARQRNLLRPHRPLPDRRVRRELIPPCQGRLVRRALPGQQALRGQRVRIPRCQDQRGQRVLLVQRERLEHKVRRASKARLGTLGRRVHREFKVQ
jgi:hypothetical protein